THPCGNHAAPCGHDCESALPGNRVPQPGRIHPETEVFRLPHSPDCSAPPKLLSSHSSQHGFYPLAPKMLVPALVGCSCERLRLFLDHAALAFRTPSVAGQCAITSDHTMTWNSQGNCVGRASVRDGTDRARFANAGGKRGVSNFIADPNPEQGVPDAPLEGCSANIERQIEPLCWGFDKRQNLFEIGA